MIRKERTMTHAEYQRRVFNKALLECFDKMNQCCNGLSHKSEDVTVCDLAKMAKTMSDAFYTDMLCLNERTIKETKKELCEAVSFIQDCVEAAETISIEKREIVDKEELDIPADQEIELSPEDEELIDKVFEDKNPELQAEEVRDATVKAMVAEDQKAQEVKDALSIAQSQVAAGGDPKALEETVQRLGNRGPTSLMNAILNNTAANTVNAVSKSNPDVKVSIGNVMAENADNIKTRAQIMYMLFEASSVFGIHKYTPAEIKKIADQLYYNKAI